MSSETLKRARDRAQSMMAANERASILADLSLEQLKERLRLNTDRGIQSSQELRNEIARREQETA
jgi:hypothetical protein